jgi:hypothetical protein
MGDKIANRGGGADANATGRYFEAADGSCIINCN